MMAANRKLPFGYEMKKGVVVPHPDEAEKVRWIYQRYIAGASYAWLMWELQRQPVPYLPGKPWNKNMVARILADRRYLGTGGFPQVIDAKLFYTVQESITRRAPPRKKSALVGVIQRLAVCGACSEGVRRVPNQHGKERWYCPACKGISPRVIDAQLEREVKRLLNELIRSPQAVAASLKKKKNVSPKVAALETEYVELLSTSDFDESAAKEQALALAAARFEALGDEDYETMRIQHVLTRAEGEEEPDTALLRQITAAVLIYPDGTVSLKLKNGQVITECNSITDQ